MSSNEENKTMKSLSLPFPALALAGYILLATPAWAEVKVDSPWVRGTTNSQKATGAFMTIISSVPATLVAATSPAAGIVEIHEMRMDGATMRMRQVDEIALPGGKRVELNPGGYHIMLMDLREPMRAGAKVLLTLKIRSSNGVMSEVAVMAEVTTLAGKKAESGDHQHSH